MEKNYATFYALDQGGVETPGGYNICLYLPDDGMFHHRTKHPISITSEDLNGIEIFDITSLSISTLLTIPRAFEPRRYELYRFIGNNEIKVHTLKSLLNAYPKLKEFRQ